MDYQARKVHFARDVHAVFEAPPDEGLLTILHRASGNNFAAWIEGAGVAVEAKGCSLVAFSGLLLHAGGTNRSATPGRVNLAQYTPEPLIDLASGEPRRDAVRLLENGGQVVFA